MTPEQRAEDLACTLVNHPVEDWPDLIEVAFRELLTFGQRAGEGERKDAERFRFLLAHMMAVSNTLRFYVGYPDKFVSAVDGMMFKKPMELQREASDGR